MKKSHLTAIVILFAVCLGLSAQTETMYERGATYLENTMPPSPEPASVVKYADVPFTHSTGMAEYDVPFYTLQGRELSIPIGLHYASGGIKLDEIAGVAGLGWTLQAGGCITRTVMDMPDEFSSSILHHEMPDGTLLAALENRVDTTYTLNYLRNLLYHRIDSSLDRYSYNVCGLSGSFVIQDDGTVFQLSGDGVLIDYTRDADGSINMFTITGPDGTVYTCSEKETATHEGRSDSPMTPTSGEPDRWSATTAWYLKSVSSRSGLETAEFTYSSPREWKRQVRSFGRTVTETVFPDVQTNDRSTQTGHTSHYIYSTYGTRALSGISFNGEEVSFSYAASTGHCQRSGDPYYQQNYPFCLSGISVRSSADRQELSRLDVFCGVAPHDGRILLNGLNLYKGGQLDDKWNFTYKTVETSVSSGSQDWYGYYNGENEFSDEGTSSTCPYEYIFSRGFELTNGFPSSEHAAYLSLSSIDNDGAVTRFIYEGSTISNMGKDYSVGIRLKCIVLSEGVLPVRVRNFTYEDPFPSSAYVPSMDIYTSVSMSFQQSAGPVWQYMWQFTLHDSPVSLGPSITDARIYYGRVTEDVTGLLKVPGSPVTHSSRTVYEYSSSDVYPSTHYEVKERFPEEWERYYDWDHAPSIASPWVGVRTCYTEDSPSCPPVLTRREEYAFEDGSYRIVSSSAYRYERESFGRTLVGYHVSQIVNHWLAGKLEYDYMYHFPIYAGCLPVKHPIRETRVGYHASGNDTTVVNTSYVNRKSLSDPIRVSSVSTTVGKVKRTMDCSYADTWSDGEWASTLESQHCLSVPVRRSVRYTESERPVIGGNIAMPVSDLSAFPDTIIHVVAPLAPPFKEEITRYGWFNVSGGQALLPSAHIEKTLGVESWREDVLTRDSRGAITSMKEKGSPQTVVLWGYSGLLPVAVIENASVSEVYEALGGRTVLIEASAGLPVPSDSYLEQLAGLRTSLLDAHVTTYTHILGKGVESVTDPAGMKTTYEYDHAGRLTCVRDNDGNKVEEYDYSLMADADRRRHMRSRVFRSSDGSEFSEDVRWWDAYGRTLQDISMGASGDGSDLVTAYGSDFMLHDDVKTWLPYPVQNTAGAFQASAESASASYHGSDHAYSLKNYELSTRDRVVSTALPGYVGEHETTFDTDIYTLGAYQAFAPVYRWEDGRVQNTGWYASDELVVEKTTDADGRVTTVCKDHSGKPVHTSVGNDRTRYVYDLYDRLRAVMGSGIEMTDTLNMWRYDYDSLGRIASKGIPGSVREHYTYDDEDRVIAVLRDGVLKEMEYDAMGRVTKVWQTMPGGQRTQLEEHIYDVYPTGVNGADPKGLKTSSRLAKIAPDGSVTGYVRVTYSYDDRKRPIKVMTKYAAGEERIDELEYTFTGEVSSSTSSYIQGNKIDVLTVDYTYDRRGRLKVETATLTPSGSAPQTAKVIHSYDDLGRPSATSSLMQNCPRLTASRSYTLQGWTDTLSVNLGDSPLFFQSMGYDAASNLSGHVPQYSGMVTMKRERWPQPSGPTPNTLECYVYDHAGRIAKSGHLGCFTEYTYDPRGNILSETLPGSSGSFGYEYDGDRIRLLVSSAADAQDTVTFTHDALGRMTFDGTTGQSMTYNSLDLVGNISREGATLVNYSYLSDGTKLSATDGGGEGLVYRGPFVYRRSSDSSSLTLESAAFGGEEQVMLPAQGNTPAHPLATAVLPDDLTLRDAYTGKEAQNPDFSTGYTDFGARQYSPTLRRWMTPDPLSEKHYGSSVYAFCENDPINFRDWDGRDTIYVFDSPHRPTDSGITGTTYTAETYVEINGKISGPYRSSSYPNSKSNSDNSTSYNTVPEETMINFNNESGHNGGTQFGLNLVDENGIREIEGISPAGNTVPMTLVNFHSGFSDNGNYNSRGSHGCLTVHPDDSAAFFNNFIWTPGKYTGSSQGKIIIFRTITPQKEKEYNRIKQRRQ